MASEAARALRAEIAKRRKSGAVAMAGLGGVLDILDAYVAATDARIEALERRAVNDSTCQCAMCRRLADG